MSQHDCLLKGINQIINKCDESNTKSISKLKCAIAYFQVNIAWDSKGL